MRALRSLTLRERLEALEGLCDLARYFHQRRLSKGLPVVPLFRDDPATLTAPTDNSRRNLVIGG